MAKIKSIVYQPEGRRYADPFRDFMRVQVDSAELVSDHGIRGDHKAGRSKSRQVNLLTSDWLEEMEESGYRTAPGEFGEQIVVEGVRFSELKTGLRLAIGKSAIIELTKPRTGCERLEAAQGKPIPTPIKAAIGFMATVIAGGPLRAGDEVRILTSDPA